MLAVCYDRQSLADEVLIYGELGEAHRRADAGSRDRVLLRIPG